MIWTDEFAFVDVILNHGHVFKFQMKGNYTTSAIRMPDLSSKPNWEQKYVEDDGEAYKCPWMHQPISAYHGLTGGLPNDIPWKVIVRNPYDRQVAQYETYKKNGAQLLGGPHLARWRAMTFPDFVNNNEPHKSDTLNSRQMRNYIESGGTHRHAFSQYKWIEGFESRTTVYKFEDLSQLETDTGLTLKSNLFGDYRYGWNGQEHDNWADYYTEELKAVIYERHKQDFTQFGYDA